MEQVIAVLLMFVLPLAFLAVVCLCGPAADRINDRRLARRREIEQAVSPYRPIRIAEWTGRGWAEVVPLTVKAA